MFNIADMNYVIDVLQGHIERGSTDGLEMLMDQVKESIKAQSFLNNEHKNMVKIEAIRQDPEN